MASGLGNGSTGFTIVFHPSACVGASAGLDLGASVGFRASVLCGGAVACAGDDPLPDVLAAAPPEVDGPAPPDAGAPNLTTVAATPCFSSKLTMAFC